MDAYMPDHGEKTAYVYSAFNGKNYLGNLKDLISSRASTDNIFIVAIDLEKSSKERLSFLILQDSLINKTNIFVDFFEGPVDDNDEDKGNRELGGNIKYFF